MDNKELDNKDKIKEMLNMLGDDDEEDEFAPRFTSCMAISELPILICKCLAGYCLVPASGA